MDASEARLVFVPTARDVVAVDPHDRVVVLDTAWTPVPGDRPGAPALRAALAVAVERHDCFAEALDALERWAATAELADRLVVEGVTYWFRVREPLWHWVHERLLWRYALHELDTASSKAVVVAPATEAALVDVVRALGRPCEVVSEAVPEAGVQARGAVMSVPGPVRSTLRRVIRRARPGPPSEAGASRRRLETLVETRFERLAAADGARVLVLTTPSTYQRVGSAERGRPMDPNLGSVIDGLAHAGVEPIVIGLGLDPRRPEDHPAIEDDDRLLPVSILRSRWSRTEDEARADAAVSSVLEGLGSAPAMALDLGGLDLSAAIMTFLRSMLERIVRADTLQAARIERLMADLRPAAVLMTKEAHRTPWLVTGARAGVPTFALQHGMLYPTHPGYPDRRHASLVLPTRTFVFGDAERRVLEGGAYHPDEVAVSGSPRLDTDRAIDAVRDPAERDAVRRELGVAAGDRLLVISTLHLPFVRRSHFIHMLEVCLGGPLPGIHVVFKQHPGEVDAGPYRDLLDGLARAGGYDPPPMTVVKDVDLYRVLRAADAHLSLHSTVLTDAVIANTCNLIAIVEASRDLLGYVASGVARPVHDVREVRHMLQDPRPPDPGARQAFLDDHFRRGDASARIVEAITTVVRAPATAPSGGLA